MLQSVTWILLYFREHSKLFLFLILGFLLILLLQPETFFPVGSPHSSLSLTLQLSVQCLLLGETFPDHSEEAFLLNLDYALCLFLS